MDKFPNYENPRITAKEYIEYLINNPGSHLTPDDLRNKRIKDEFSVGQAQFRGYACKTGRTTTIDLNVEEVSTKGTYLLVHRRPVDQIIYPEGTGVDRSHSFTIIKHKISGLAIGFIDL